MSGPRDRGNSVTDPPTEAASNDRWQAEADEPGVERPGIVASLLRYRFVLVAAALLGAVAGYGVSQLLPVRYQTEAKLVLADPGGPSVLGGGTSLTSSDRQVYLAKQVNIMTSRVVLERALQLLGSRQSVREARDELEVQPSADLASISIVATGSDPRSAAALANAVGTAYERVTEERAAGEASRAIASLEKVMRRLQARLDASPKTPDGRLTSGQQQLAGQITDLQGRVREIAVQAEVYASGVELFEQAERPTAPVQPKPKLAAALGGLLGLLIAGAWAWRSAARNQRAEGRGDPARILGAPLLGEVPRLRAPQLVEGRPVASPPGLDPAIADAFHFVVASLEHELAAVGGKSVAMTSVGPGDGRTSTALQIANAASQENRKILLIDADVRMRHLSELFGFAEVAREGNGQVPPGPNGQPVDAKEYVRRLVSTDSGMVLPVAPNRADPLRPVGSYHAVDVRHAVRSIGELFDLVLIDTPAVLVSSNALGVAGQADGVVLVVSHRVSLGHLRDVRERLAFVKTPLIGYIYVRPRGLGVRALWAQLRGPGRGPESRMAGPERGHGA
jgi:Mrp family chromosome partitioning ATPase/capsular polysaccharide biosynthesis protein